MTILITGAGGFIGKNLTTYLGQYYELLSVFSKKSKKVGGKSIVKLNLENTEECLNYFSCHYGNVDLGAIIHLASYLPMEKEVEDIKVLLKNINIANTVLGLSKLLNPEKPFVAIIGGAKADKIGVMRALLSKVDSLIIGGVLANTFLKAKGVDIRKSKFDEESLQHAKEFIGNKKILLPVDVIVADRFEENADSKEVSINKIPNDWMVMDSL